MDLLRNQLKTVYEDFHMQLFTIALSITRDRDLAEDAIHNTFLSILKRNFMPEDLKLYVFKSVRNSAVDIIRKKKILPLCEGNNYIFDNSSSLEEEMEQKEFKQQVAEGLLKLTANERETIIQHLYAELTFIEISNILDAPIGTVTSWYRRGIAKLKEFCKE